MEYEWVFALSFVATFLISVLVANQKFYSRFRGWILVASDLMVTFLAFWFPFRAIFLNVPSAFDQGAMVFSMLALLFYSHLRALSSDRVKSQ